VGNWETGRKDEAVLLFRELVWRNCQFLSRGVFVSGILFVFSKSARID